MTTERVHCYSTHHLSIPMHIDRMWDVVESYEKGGSLLSSMTILKCIK